MLLGNSFQNDGPLTVNDPDANMLACFGYKKSFGRRSELPPTSEVSCSNPTPYVGKLVVAYRQLTV